MSHSLRDFVVRKYVRCVSNPRLAEPLGVCSPWIQHSCVGDGVLGDVGILILIKYLIKNKLLCCIYLEEVFFPTSLGKGCS